MSFGIGTPSIVVDVEGQQFTNFMSLELTRSKEDMTCSGSMIVSWPGAEVVNAQTPPMQEMKDGAKITIYLDGKKAATGRIDKRQGSGSPTQYQLNLTFRGLASSLVDSSADHPSGQENKKTPGDITKKLMEGYESKLIDKSDEKRQLKRYVLREGETIERAIRTATREHGLIAHENEDGDVVLEKKDADEGDGMDLVVGQNFTEWSVSRDIAPRASKVKAKGSKVSTDESYGKDAEELKGEAKDEYVKFKKEKHILVDGDHDKETLKKRAISEARRRAADGLTVELTMDGFTEQGGELWKVGRKHNVSIPIENLDEQLIIKQVKFTASYDNLETQITLVPKESYSSEEGKGGDGKGKTKAKKSPKAKDSKKGGSGGGGGGADSPFDPADGIS